MEKRLPNESTAQSVPSREGGDRRKSIFISSTFRDMQAERDAIHNIISPKVNEFARKHGGFVNFIDLRWGIDTSSKKDSEDKVLRICLNEIDVCRPYFIGLIGDYYGSMPGPEKMKKTAKKHNIKGLSDPDISITELEINYGVLSGKGPFDASLFYFRNPMNYDAMPENIRKKYNDNKSEKVDQLKKKIMENAKIRQEISVNRYETIWDEDERTISNVDDLAEKMTSDVIKRLSKEWGVENDVVTDIPWQEQSMISDRYIIMSKNSCFIGRNEIIENCIEFINDSSAEGALVIEGEPGVGKSTFMARLTEVLPCRNMDVISTFCGSGPRTNSIIDIIKSISYRLELLLGKTEHFDDNPAPDSISELESKTMVEWINNILNLAYEHKMTRDRPIVILVDALDQLPTIEREDSLQQLSNINAPNLSVIVTFIEGSQIKEPNGIRNWILPPISEKEVLETSKRIFKDNHKELYEVVSKAIVQKEGTRNHLYLSMLLQRLMMTDSEDLSNIKSDNWSEAHANLMIEMIKIAPEDVSGLSLHIIDEALSRLSSNAVQKSLEYLAVARCGLRETDLEKIVEGWNTVDFRTLLLYLNTFFTERSDGRMDFSHRIIREGILREVKNDQNIHADILDHFKILNIHDTVKLSETVYHACRGGASEYLCSFLSAVHYDDATSLVLPSVLEELGNDSMTIVKVASIAGERFKEYAGCAEFLVFDLCDDIKYQNIRVLKRLSNMLDRFLHFIQPNITDAKSARIVSVCINRKGDVLELFRDRSGAMKCYEQSLTIRRALVADAPSLELRRDLVLSLERIGELLIPQDIPSARKYFEEALEIIRSLVFEFTNPQLRHDLAACLHKLGHILELSKDPIGSKKYYDESASIFKSLASESKTPKVHVGLIVALIKEGDICIESGDRLDAKKHFGEALTIARSMYSESRTPEACATLSIVLRRIGNLLILSDPINAKKHFGEALTIARSLASDLKTPKAYLDLFRDLNDVGHSFMSSVDVSEAIKHFEESLTIARFIITDLKTPTARLDLSKGLNGVGYGLISSKCSKEAVKYIEEALIIARSITSEDEASEKRSSIILSMKMLGNICMESRDLQGALEYFEEVVKTIRTMISERATRKLRHDLSSGLNLIGNILKSNGDIPGAIKCYEEDLVQIRILISEGATPELHQELSARLKILGDILKSDWDISGAIKCYEERLTTTRYLAAEFRTPDSRKDLAISLLDLITCFIKRHRDSEIRKYEEELDAIEDIDEILKSLGIS